MFVHDRPPPADLEERIRSVAALLRASANRALSAEEARALAELQHVVNALTGGLSEHYLDPRR